MSEAFPRSAIEAALDAGIVRFHALSGGCISPVYRLETEDGRQLVAKHGDPGGGLDLEAWMLKRLRDAGWPVPAVHVAERDLLIMDFIDSDGDVAGGEAHAAECLAALHGAPQTHFGLERDTVIAGLAQANPRSERWVPFFAEHRLLAMALQAREARELEPELHRRLERLAGRLERWLQEPDSPSLIHGDLWGGNLLFHDGELRAVIDPACYCADAEIELAFTTLFNTFGERFFGHYQELRPLAPGFFEERCDLYNLYPLLVHLRLFGGSYAAPIQATLRRFGV